MDEAHDDVEDSLSDEDELLSHEELPVAEEASAVHVGESSRDDETSHGIKEESPSVEPKESVADTIEPILLDAVMVESRPTRKAKKENQKKGKKKKNKKGKKKGKKGKKKK
jgi:hypothetical protein